MKTTATTKIAVLTLAVLAVLCTPLMTLTVHAQAHSSYTGAHNAIAYLAEKEIQANELKAQADKKFGKKVSLVKNMWISKQLKKG